MYKLYYCIIDITKVLKTDFRASDFKNKIFIFLIVLLRFFIKKLNLWITSRAIERYKDNSFLTTLTTLIEKDGLISMLCKKIRRGI